MAVVFGDGFDHYQSVGPASNCDLLRKWSGWYFNGDGSSNPDVIVGHSQTQTGVGDTVIARGGLGQGIMFTGNSRYLGKAFTAQATLTSGVAVKFNSLPGSTPMLWYGDALTGGGPYIQVALAGDGAGHLQVVAGGSTVLATSTNTVTPGVYYYIEFKATIHNTTGVIEVRVNNTSTGWVPSTGSLNTRNASSTNNSAGLAGLAMTSSFVCYDDYYLVDTTNASGVGNTSFLGPVRVAALRPNAAGNYSQWTPNAGANFSNVADMPTPDGDSTFNQSSTAGQIDSYLFEDVPAASGSIFAIQHNIYARQDGGAQRTFARLIRRSSTDYVGATQSPSSTYAYFQQIDEADPSTSAAWTIPNLNAAEIGVKLLS